MYKENDYLVYGKDICQVEKIEEKKFNNEDYYLLRPLKNKSLKISAPISDKANKIRDLITKEEIEVLISKIPAITIITTDDKFIESETISLCKLIRRMGKTVQIPHYKQVSFFDTVYNCPIFDCGDLSAANCVIAAIKRFCELWHTKADRIISFTLKIPFENRTGVFKFLGHVDDFFEYYSSGFDFIPEKENI